MTESVESGSRDDAYDLARFVRAQADGPVVNTIELRLAVASTDLRRFEPTLHTVASLGVEFTTLAEEQSRRADWLARFCDLDNATRSHDVQVPRTVDQMRDRLAWLEFTPDSCVLATLPDRYIGYTYLDRTHSAPGVLVQGWTGVRPGHRRRGVATALKVHGILLAGRLGYSEIVTRLRPDNRSSIAMNERLGFRLSRNPSGP